MQIINSMKESLEAFEKGTLPFNILQDYNWVLIEPDALREAKDITLEQIKKSAEMDYNDKYSNYDYLLGGCLNILETEEDLKEIEGIDFEFAEENNDRWPNMTDQPISSDTCCVIHGEPEFIMFLLCTNNAGGNSYYIPKTLWTKNVLESLNLDM